MTWKRKPRRSDSDRTESFRIKRQEGSRGCLRRARLGRKNVSTVPEGGGRPCREGPDRPSQPLCWLSKHAQKPLAVRLCCSGERGQAHVGVGVPRARPRAKPV